MEAGEILEKHIRGLKTCATLNAHYEERKAFLVQTQRQIHPYAWDESAGAVRYCDPYRGCPLLHSPSESVFYYLLEAKCRSYSAVDVVVDVQK